MGPKDAYGMTNSEDPDLDLHCLPLPVSEYIRSLRYSSL